MPQSNTQATVPPSLALLKSGCFWNAHERAVEISPDAVLRMTITLLPQVAEDWLTEIAQTIRGNKGQGTATYGTTSVTVPDTYGNPHVISFSRSTDVPIFVAITLKVFTGYTSQIGEQIKQAVADYINGLTIGDDVLLSRIYSPANLGVVSGGNARYYDITDLLIGKSSGSVSASNIDIAYDASASCSTANISITVTS